MCNIPLTPDELLHFTNDHWSRNDTQWYIENLLPCEMEYAQQEVKEYDTLALMIGFSEDPLLQTIWKYRPKRIVLVLNHKYKDKEGRDQGGKRRSEEWIKWIRLMTEKGYCSSSAIERLEKNSTRTQDIAVATSEAQPDWVFRELRDRLLPDQRDRKQIMVDITGAKKSMASGAFLFAAYAGVDISYVDFDDYHPTKRRPLGYTCRIDTQPNPYRILGLRDWERVQKLYEQFAFGSAAIELEQLSTSMSAGLSAAAGAGNYFSEKQRQAIARLTKVMTVLDQWDNGDFASAWKQWSENVEDGTPGLQNQMPKFSLPHAIQYLGSRGWPSAVAKDAGAFLQQHRDLKRGTTRPEDSIFNQPDLLLTYAYDELDKIKRLIDRQNDYRSAFLRSAGLDELLLKARVAILWLTDRLFLAGKPRSDHVDEHLKFNGLADYSSADNLRDFLCGINRKNPSDPAGLRIRYWDNAIQKDVGLTRKDSSVIIMTEYWNRPECTIGHEALVDLRGEAIHTHLSIPISYAQAAYQLVDYALNDFRDHWVGLLKRPYPDHQTWQLAWSDLCADCKLDFLPALPTSKEPIS